MSSGAHGVRRNSSEATAQEAFGGILSIVAVVFVTWMVFWTKRASRTLKGELHDKMSAAIEIATIGVFTLQCILVDPATGQPTPNSA
jgi:high-affinity iron transporter